MKRPTYVSKAEARLAWRVGEFAKSVGVVPHTVYRWIREGVVSTVNLGGTVLIPDAEVKRILSLAPEPAAKEEVAP